MKTKINDKQTLKAIFERFENEPKGRFSKTDLNCNDEQLKELERMKLIEDVTMTKEIVYQLKKIYAWEPVIHTTSYKNCRNCEWCRISHNYTTGHSLPFCLARHNRLLLPNNGKELKEFDHIGNSTCSAFKESKCSYESEDRLEFISQKEMPCTISYAKWTDEVEK